MTAQQEELSERSACESERTGAVSAQSHSLNISVVLTYMERKRRSSWSRDMFVRKLMYLPLPSERESALVVLPSDSRRAQSNDQVHEPVTPSSRATKPTLIFSPTYTFCTSSPCGRDRPMPKPGPAEPAHPILSSRPEEGGRTLATCSVRRHCWNSRVVSLAPLQSRSLVGLSSKYMECMKN